MKSTSRLASAVAAAAALALAATALASTPAGSQVKAKKTSTLGTILVDGKGHTLYLFGKDKRDKSLCSGACAANWPPYLTTAKPKAMPGVKAAWLGTTKRAGGKLQVTYNHHPLYTFKFDKVAGSTKGENVEAFGGEWDAVSAAKGAKVEPPASTGGTSGGGGGGNPPPSPPPPYPPAPNYP